MAAIVRAERRWGGRVPYKIPEHWPDHDWLVQKIGLFNSSFGRAIFVSWTNETDYALFGEGANSPIGKQGGQQLLKYNHHNLFHEMGHCVGLGHTYFHTGCRLPELFEGIDREAYDNARNAYIDQDSAYTDSVMNYTPTAFVASPRIVRVCTLCERSRTNLDRATQDLSTLIGLRRTISTGGGGGAPAPGPPPRAGSSIGPPPPAGPRARAGSSIGAPPPAGPRARALSLSSGAPRPTSIQGSTLTMVGGLVDQSIPAVFRDNLMWYRIGNRWEQRQIRTNQDLGRLSDEDLNQFAADIEIVKDYWVFDEDHMMQLSNDDAQAARAVWGFELRSAGGIAGWANRNQRRGSDG